MSASDAVTYCPCASCGAVNRVRLTAGKPVCAKCKKPLPLKDGVVALEAPGDGGLGALTQKSPLPVVVDFWAEWCGPCKAFAPTFVQAASRSAGKVVFAKLDTERAPQASAAHGIRGIPTVILFHGGREVQRQSGAMSLPQLSQWLADALASGSGAAAASQA